MTTRNDVAIDFRSSPRALEVDAPSVQMTMQDLVDTLRKLEDQFTGGMSFSKLLNASGKEDLGGGVKVGITVALQNLLLAFEGRTTPAQVGTVTGAPANPIDTRQTMQDSAATFIANGITRGSLLINFTDQSVAEVYRVNSETELETKLLVQGVGNTYDTADVYKIWNIVQCNATGGNLVALDEFGATLDSPILPTAFTQVILTSSASATLQDLELTDLKFQIESLRADHQGFGELFFVDPVGGDNTNNGTTNTSPVKTIQYAHDNLVVSGRNDIIYVVNPNGAPSVSIGDVIISKDEVHIRGAGRSIAVEGANPGGTIFTIDGNGCSIDALLIDGINLCNYCVVVNGRHFRMGKPWVKQAVLDNILIRGGDYHEFLDMENEKAGGSGIRMVDAGLPSGSPREITIEGASNIYLNGDDGISIESNLGAGAGASTRLVRIRGEGHIFNNTNYGIDIDANCDGTTISNGVNVYDNTLGEVRNQGTNTQDFRTFPDIRTMRKLLQNRMETDPITGVMTIYDDDDVTVLLSGNIYEDVLASQIYRGRGMERRNRLT